MCFGRAGFIWCQAILSRRSELKVLTLPAEGPAAGGQLRLPRSPASQTYWDASFFLRSIFFDKTPESTLEKRLLLQVTQQNSVRAMGKPVFVDSLEPQKQFLLYLCIAHGNVLLIGSCVLEPAASPPAYERSLIAHCTQ